MELRKKETYIDTIGRAINHTRKKMTYQKRKRLALSAISEAGRITSRGMCETSINNLWSE